MIEGVNDILQIYSQSQLPPKVRLKTEAMPYLQRLDLKIDRLKSKYMKMDREYKRLHTIFINSEHRKKENDIITGIKV
jgi:hypothetical protein